MYPEVTEDLREDVQKHSHGLKHCIVVDVRALVVASGKPVGQLRLIGLYESRGRKVPDRKF